jgi:L-malate glycosyltransferase
MNKSILFLPRLRRGLWNFFARQFMLYCVIALEIAGWIGRKRRPIGDRGCEIMLTGRFDSKNWILAHLVPLAQSKECSRLWMVSTNPVPEIPKVEAIYPPKWMIKSFGATPSRLLIFLWAAIRKRPHVVGGFHLIYNGIAAAIVGRLAGAKSIYFCVGGTEVDNEGIADEPNCFMKTKAADVKLRSRRLKIVSSFDLIITMGSRAAKFFRNNGINTDIYVVSGGIDAKRFYPRREEASIDIIFVARLSAEKRIDVFLQAVRLVADKLPDVKVMIIGDGDLRDELQRQAKELAIDQNVNFAGHRDDVDNLLRGAKVFVLTSDLEGLALSVIEAMMCGLPAVVSDVGDLADLVEDGVNGYLVPRRHPELFAKRLVELLSDVDKLMSFSQAARKSALQYETQATIKRWDDIITSFRNHS